MLGDPAEVAHGADHGRIEMSGGYVSVEILEARRLRERRDPQPLTEAGILAFGELVLQEHGEAFLEAQGAGVGIAELALEGAEHAGEFEFIEQLQQGFDQHGESPFGGHWK